jgi:CheY-like chemotaxis protein
MEAVGQLAGGLAHDYNNLLMVISGNAELLLLDRESPELREILTAASSANVLTNRLLTFSSQTTHNARAVQLAEDIEVAKDLLRRALGDRIVTRYELNADTWPVLVDRGQIQHILLNLALNARDAMPEGGSLTISMREQRLDGAEATRRRAKSGDYLTLTVTDTGCGMDEAIRARVFEPFFTTKPLGRGTGLGLAMVFGSMKQCGGFVEVFSQPGIGSSFRLWFPRASEQAGRASEPGPESPRSDARVLLVEDNPAVAHVAKRILESAGYRVRVSDDPHGALLAWHSDPADVLVTDVEMPGMSGIQLSERLRATTPDLRTLFITGHSTEHIDVQAHPGRVAIVMKPFRRDDLLQALAELLEAP